jgi:hypothetical protein
MTFEEPQYWQVRINFRTTITMTFIRLSEFLEKFISLSIEWSTRRDYS